MTAVIDAMHPQAARDVLRQLAEGLAQAIAGSRRISRTLGPALRGRLQSDDWIKSPVLVSFLRPMKPPSPLENPPDVHQGIVAQVSDVPPGATSLYALESVLSDVDKESVSGIEHWFAELGHHEGYWLDKRLQSWSFEIAAMPRLRSQRIVKLPKLPASKGPDYVVRAPGVTLVMEAKLIFGPTWPLKILQTMLEALDDIAGWDEAGSVFVYPVDRDLDTSVLENEVATLAVDTLLHAISEVISRATDVLLTPHLVMSPRSVTERLLRLRAFSARLPSRPDQIDALFDSLRTPVDTIRRAAEAAWEQCAGCRHPDGTELRLDIALIGSENLPVVVDFGRTELALKEWLGREVWPNQPFRGLCFYLTGRLHPVWLLGPAAASWPVT